MFLLMAEKQREPESDFYLYLFPGCQDDPEQRDFCPTFKKSGFCETMKGNMKRLCKKTCDLCDESCKLRFLPLNTFGVWFYG